MPTPQNDCESRRNILLAMALFDLILAIYLLTFSGFFHNPDEGGAFGVVESIVKHGRFNIGQMAWGGETNPSGNMGVGGEWYSEKAIGISLLAAPLYWVALNVPGFGLEQTALLLNVFLTAGCGTLLFFYAKRLGYSSTVGLALGLIFSFCTWAWVYSRSFFTDVPVGFCLVGAAYFFLRVRNKPSLLDITIGSSLLGLSVLVRPTSAVLLPIFLGYLLWSLRHSLRQPPTMWPAILFFSLPCFVALLITAVFNYVRFGDLLNFGYVMGFTAPLPVGFTSFLFSLDRSIFLYSPILLVSLIGLPIFIRQHTAEGALVLIAATAQALVYSRWEMFWGGPVWGPRHLVPILPLLVLPILPVFDRVTKRKSLLIAFLALLCLSALIQIKGTVFNLLPYLQQHGQRYPLLFAPLSGNSLDLAWIRPTQEGWDIDPLVPVLTLAVAILAAASLFLYQRISITQKGMLASMALAVFLPGALIAFSLTRYYDDSAYGQRDDYRDVIDFLEISGKPEDVLLLTMPLYMDFMKADNYFMNYYKALPTYYFLLSEAPLPERSLDFLRWLVTRGPRLWLMLDAIPPADPQSAIEKWLDENAFLAECRWFGSTVRLCQYSTPKASMPEPSPRQASWDDEIQLVAYSLQSASHAGQSQEIRPGDTIQVRLYWRAQRQMTTKYTVSLQLHDSQGRLRAQIDRQPSNGLAPTSSWTVGEIVQDNYGLVLPLDLPTGDYSLVVGIYDPSSLERLQVRDVTGRASGDYMLVSPLRVR